MYKTFVRSQLEYGLQLRPLLQREVQPLQRVQNAALQAIFSVGPRTSTSALHIVTDIPTMLQRNHVLNASFFHQLHHSRNHNHTATVLYRDLTSAAQQNISNTSCLQQTLLKNPLWTELPKPNLDHLELRAEPRDLDGRGKMKKIEAPQQRRWHWPTPRAGRFGGEIIGHTARSRTQTSLDCPPWEESNKRNSKAIGAKAAREDNVSPTV
ncbi:hypothetical protein HK102_006165 [Quaeritorhiza haematococci]|nr:hypothetical protein HK102_006165 [Quaeritorhiza haematococci]